jgi:hypothetical protein
MKTDLTEGNEVNEGVRRQDHDRQDHWGEKFNAEKFARTAKNLREDYCKD